MKIERLVEAVKSNQGRIDANVETIETNSAMIHHLAQQIEELQKQLDTHRGLFFGDKR